MSDLPKSVKIKEGPFESFDGIVDEMMERAVEALLSRPRSALEIVE